MSAAKDPRRELPSVTALLESDGVRALLAATPRALVTDAVRDAIERARSKNGDVPRDAKEWTAAVAAALETRARRSLRPVINATGVVLHTNLGRAPLPRAALDAVAAVAAANLRSSGRRLLWSMPIMSRPRRATLVLSAAEWMRSISLLALVGVKRRE